MNMIKTISLAIAVIIAFVLISGFAVPASAITGLEIMQRVKDRDDGDDQVSDMEMILIDKKGNRRLRKIRNFRKDFGKDTYSVMFFLEPADVKNTGFLTYDYDAEGKDDDQWLYLPALHKTKRIASSDKSGSFMGSDFNYSDMSEPDLSNYAYKLMKESIIDGIKTWQVEAIPKNKEVADGSGYSKSILFVRQDNDMVIRAVRWVYKKKKRQKFMKADKLEKIDGIWVATENHMTTKEGKVIVHSTIIRNYNIKFNQKLDESFFTTRQLEKGM